MVRLSFRTIEVQKLYPIVISRGSQASSENLFVFATEGDHTGIGELSPAISSSWTAATGQAQLEALWEDLDPSFSTARSLGRELLALYQGLNDTWGIVGALQYLALVADQEGDRPSAWSLSVEALALACERDDPAQIADSLEGFAALASTQGQEERGARLSGAAEQLREAISAPLPTSVCWRGA